MNSVPYEIDKSPTPDILLSGATVDQLMIFLNAPMVFCRTTTGALHGFVDPAPVVSILKQALKAELQRQGIPTENSVWHS